MRRTLGGIALEIAEILRTKLQGIDTECEAAALLDINNLYGQARYDGSKFVAPSFQDAGAVWLKLISEKERRFVSEVERVCAVSDTVLDAGGQKKVEEIIGQLLGEDRYIERLQGFSEGVARRAASYGSQPDLGRRFNIADAAYRAGVMNATRKARNNVQAEMSLHSRFAVPESVNKFAKWWIYTKEHPWKASAALVFLVLIPWIASNLWSILASSGEP